MNDKNDLDLRDGALPLYSQIAHQIEMQISHGVYPIGSNLPPQMELAKKFNVSRITIVKAEKLLLQRNILISRRGSGVTVVKQSFNKNRYVTNGFGTQFEKDNKDIYTKIISKEKVPCPNIVAQSFMIMEGEPVILLVRVRYLDKIPVCVEHNYYRYSRTMENIVRELKDNESIYASFKKHNINLSYAEEKMKVVIPDESVCDLLKVKKKFVLLNIIRETNQEIDGSNIPVEFCDNFYNTNKYGYYGVLSINLKSK
ncbi:MAG: GntR family transcriptional regulator [Sphaerochaetaceae bacterium]|nr:GntR family transcriptional regulator [Sphaerochaetaceae bacterium]